MVLIMRVRIVEVFRLEVRALTIYTQDRDQFVERARLA